jgi:hypothetical protein
MTYLELRSVWDCLWDNLANCPTNTSRSNQFAIAIMAYLKLGQTQAALASQPKTPRDERIERRREA